MNKEGFEFDLETRRFLINRWETELGKKVQKEIIEGLQNSVEIRAILDDYVLEHSENADPYGHPIYPKNAMKENSFWVLTQDDLRGIRIFNTDLSSTPSLEKKALSYSWFYRCNLTSANIEQSDMSFATFEKCNLENAILAYSGGFDVILKECNLKRACLYNSWFIDSEFYDSDLSGVMFENAKFSNIKVNYKTKFDIKLRNLYDERALPPDQKPDLLRSIRVAYENIELWPERDAFLFEEKTAQRKYLLWTELKQSINIKNLLLWGYSYFSSLLSGYSTKPLRVIWSSLVIIILFSVLFFYMNFRYSYKSLTNSIIGAMGYSFSNFTGKTSLLGWEVQKSSLTEIIALSEHIFGIVMISLFVVVLAKKLIR
ncbi:pentapeptide repeat-containing protein [Legionella pneumophila serogroup 1]